jgi:hypothetical protein
MRSYIERILRYRWLVIGLTRLVTGGLAFQAKNLNIIIDPNTVLRSRTRTCRRPTKLKKCSALSMLL